MLIALAYTITQIVPRTQPLIKYPLAATIWAEARNQSPRGQRAVGHVIMNRVRARSKRFGKGLRGVTFKRKQFSCWNRNDPNRAAYFRMIRMPANSPERMAYERIRKLAADIYSGRERSNIGNATFYATVSITPYWRYDMTAVGQIGDHVFFRPQTAAERRAYDRDMKANKLLTKARRVARRGHIKRGAILHRYRVGG